MPPLVLPAKQAFDLPRERTTSPTYRTSAENFLCARIETESPRFSMRRAESEKVLSATFRSSADNLLSHQFTPAASSLASPPFLSPRTVQTQDSSGAHWRIRPDNSPRFKAGVVHGVPNVKISSTKCKEFGRNGHSFEWVDSSHCSQLSHPCTDGTRKASASPFQRASSRNARKNDSDFVKLRLQDPTLPKGAEFTTESHDGVSPRGELAGTAPAGITPRNDLDGIRGRFMELSWSSDRRHEKRHDGSLGKSEVAERCSSSVLSAKTNVDRHRMAAGRPPPRTRAQDVKATSAWVQDFRAESRSESPCRQPSSSSSSPKRQEKTKLQTPQVALDKEL